MVYALLPEESVAELVQAIVTASLYLAVSGRFRFLFGNDTEGNQYHGLGFEVRC